MSRQKQLNTNVSSKEINVIKVLDLAEYEELPEKDARTLYLIRG